MTFKTFVFASLAILISHTASAVTVTGLYEGTVAVADQSSASQARGIRLALLQVMVKLTGQRDAGSIHGVSDILDNANRFLQQYEFRSLPDTETSGVRQLLWARFDSNAVQNEVRQYSIPIWSQERPSTLVWMVIQDDLGQRFANLDQASRYMQVLTEQANARGIEFETPLHDLQDSANLKSADVVAGNLALVEQASRRYIADAVLSAVVTNAGAGIWEVQWASIVEGQTRNWSTSGATASEAISEGVDALADTLASVYSQNTGYASESSYDIQVTGINNFPAYANTLRYLESLNFISQVNINKASNESITYSLTAHGDISALEKAVRLGRVLQPAGDGQSFRYIQ